MRITQNDLEKFWIIFHDVQTAIYLSVSSFILSYIDSAHY